mmetsp:Transcript_6127/g.10009  ORF Transcript_6127/g.10009 Transcript_6127/m.10009 type:complete len:117 (+) Transcript_6127:94-444(+)
MEQDSSQSLEQETETHADGNYPHQPNLEQQEMSMLINIHVQGKVIPIKCGNGTQTIKWAGHVAIARWDDRDFEGWKTLGVPTSISKANGETLDFNSTIKDICESGEHLSVETSMNP